MEDVFYYVVFWVFCLPVIALVWNQGVGSLVEDTPASKAFRNNYLLVYCMQMREWHRHAHGAAVCAYRRPAAAQAVGPAVCAQQNLTGHSSCSCCPASLAWLGLAPPCCTHTRPPCVPACSRRLAAGAVRVCAL
jgi:hypothetical protein